MTSGAFYRLLADPAATSRWYLMSPRDSAGREIDPRIFTQGVPIGPRWLARCLDRLRRGEEAPRGQERVWSEVRAGRLIGHLGGLGCPADQEFGLESPCLAVVGRNLAAPAERVCRDVREAPAE